MINQMPAKCKFKNQQGIKCTKYASYCLPGTKGLTHCATHKEPNMINPRKDSRGCKHKDHGPNNPAPRASFNFPNMKPLYCKAHAEPGMINLNSVKNMCKGCNKKQPSYGLPGKKATHCSKCASSDMIDRISRLCEEPGCRKNVTRGFPGSKPVRCKTHQLPGMIDVKNKKCCVCVELKVSKSKQPTFGFSEATHCTDHKVPKMRDRKHDTERCSCGKRATYSLGTYPTHCALHKEDDMKDVVSKMCAKCGDRQGVFGLTKKQLFCKSCSSPTMKNIVAKMCEGCGVKQPVHNYKYEKVGRFCSGCKLEGMEDVINPRCKSCSLFLVKSKRDCCSYCSPKSTLRQKTREMKVVDFLEKAEIKFIHNKSVGFVCGNYRPDVKIDAGTHMVIVEIDEDQHKQYPQDCEIARMLNIHQAEGMRCVFLRYNPDVFRDSTHAIKVHQHTRLNILLKHVQKHMRKIPKKEVSVYRLFYNNDEGKHVTRYDIGEASLRILFSKKINE